MKAERVVCDTNVLISAALMPLGKPRRILDHVRSQGQLLICQEAMDELATRLARPKFDRYLSQDARLTFIDAVFSAAEIVVVPGALQVCRDPDDDKMLETAIVGGADCLVTGDTDLLVLRPCGDAWNDADDSTVVFRGVAIVRPAEMLARLDLV